MHLHLIYPVVPPPGTSPKKGFGDVPVPPWGQRHWHRVPRGRRSLDAPSPTSAVSLRGLSAVFFGGGGYNSYPAPRGAGCDGVDGPHRGVWGLVGVLGHTLRFWHPPWPHGGSCLGHPNPAGGPWACGAGGQAGLNPVKPGPPAATSAPGNPPASSRAGATLRWPRGPQGHRAPAAGCPTVLGDFGVHRGPVGISRATP